MRKGKVSVKIIQVFIDKATIQIQDCLISQWTHINRIGSLLCLIVWLCLQITTTKNLDVLTLSITKRLELHVSRASWIMSPSMTELYYLRCFGFSPHDLKMAAMLPNSISLYDNIHRLKRNAKGVLPTCVHLYQEGNVSQNTPANTLF